MFDWCRKLFGEGKIRISGELIDGSPFTAKVKYIGDINTLDEDELFSNLRRDVLVNHGKHVRLSSLRVVGVTYE